MLGEHAWRTCLEDILGGHAGRTYLEDRFGGHAGRTYLEDRFGGHSLRTCLEETGKSLFWLLWVEVLISRSGAGYTRQSLCLSVSLSSSSSPAVATDALPGTPRAAVTANCSFSCSHLSPHLVVLHQSCFKQRRVNLHILQAASLPIYLSSSPPPPSPPLCSSQTGLCCQALPERWGCHE